MMAVAKFLAYLQVHHIQFAGLKASVVAASCIIVGHKIYCKARKDLMDAELKIKFSGAEMRLKLIEFSQCEPKTLSQNSKMLYFLHENLDTQLKDLKQVRKTFKPILKAVLKC